MTRVGESEIRAAIHAAAGAIKPEDDPFEWEENTTEGVLTAYRMAISQDGLGPERILMSLTLPDGRYVAMKIEPGHTVVVEPLP